MLIIAIAFFATAFTFSDIPWNAPGDTVVKKLKSAGFIDVKKEKKTHGYSFRGTVLNHEAVGSAVMEQGKLVKVVVMLAVNDPNTRRGYNEIREMLIQQYGEPAKTIAAFHEPFHEGDGYETEAIRAGGALFQTQWTDDGHVLTANITPTLAVALTYE